jgi:hypothetical protein
MRQSCVDSFIETTRIAFRPAGTHGGLTAVRRGDSLTAGVQGASRPRTGLSPPEQRYDVPNGSCEPPTHPTSGLGYFHGGSSCQLAACPLVRTWIS